MRHEGTLHTKASMSAAIAIPPYKHDARTVIAVAPAAIEPVISAADLERELEAELDRRRLELEALYAS